MPPASAHSRSISQIIQTLNDSIPILQKKQILAGFDGFIDTIAKPVRKFGADGKCEYFDTIAEFGAFIGEHSHKSKSIQYEILQRKSGGNLSNFVSALDALSLQVAAIGMFSNEAGVIDPFFAGLGKKRYSYFAAGSAIALEFNDGKIFLSQANVPGITHDEKLFWRIENAFPEFRDAVSGADMIAFLNWSELPFAQDLWNDVYINALSSAETDKSRFAFFDLSDTGAKNHAEIKAVVSLIRKIGERRSTILSLNKNEALDVGGKTGCRFSSMDDTAKFLFELFNLDELVIHQHTGSFAVSAGGGTVGGESARVGIATELCVFQKNPKISTGAGDNFNAAYCCGTLVALPIAEKLCFASAYASAYVAEGSSPGLRYFS